MKFRDYSNYEIYSDGKIWSYKSNKWLKPTNLPNGYQRVWLFNNDGKAKMYFVHRVVWEAVTGEPIPPDKEINHIDERKDNNSISNLNLMTRKENINWGSGIERCHKALRKQVGAFNNGELIMSFPSIAECGRQGFSSGNVSACCRNCYLREGNNVYRGFEWRYLHNF